MDFTINEEQLMIKQLARDFTEKEIKPVAQDLDEEETFPHEVMTRLKEVELVNLAVPEKYGGPGIDKLSHALVVEEIARGCAAVATTVEANSLASYPLLIGGTEEQCHEFLGRLTKGEYAAFALTEPQAGSDVASLSTKVVRDGDEYILNGEKCFITNAQYADLFVLLAKQVEGEVSKGFTALVIEAKSEGITVGPAEKKMGLRASNTASVYFDSVRVPVANRIGEEGDGLKIFLQALTLARPMIGAQAVGIAQRAYEEALSYAKERKQFGKSIANFQSIQFMLADMAMEVEAARLLVHQAAYFVQQGKPSLVHASFAKCFASDVAMKVATNAVQIFGGYGYMREYAVEKLMRDAKIMQIYEGTNQIQRLVIARHILQD